MVLETLNNLDLYGIQRQKINDNFEKLLFSGSALQTFITNNRYVRLGVGTWNLSNLTIPVGTIIQGVPGKTIFEVTAGNTGVTLSSADVVIDGVDFRSTSTVTAITDIAGLKAKTGVGTTTGLSITGANGRQVIRNCRFYGFNDTGLKVSSGGTTYKNGLKISDCFFEGCYHGLWIRSGAEYSHFSSITAYACQIGVEVDAGNSLLSMIHADGNTVGIYVTGLNVSNDSHGSISTSTFNHSALKGIVVVDITNGFPFANCQLYAGGLHVENSKGFSYIGGTIAGGIKIDGGANAGMSMIHNCFFASGAGNVLGTGTVSLKNNYWTTGADNATINNTI